jgi:hypothetical protein
MSEKKVCYVMNLATREQRVVLELCSGINISGRTIIPRGKASAMMCSTAEFPARTDRKRAEKVRRMGPDCLDWSRTSRSPSGRRRDDSVDPSFRASSFHVISPRMTS